MAKQIRTLEQRIRIIEEVEKNPFEKRIHIARRLNLKPSTLNSIISKKDDIRKQAEKFGTSAKKRKIGREAKFEDLESLLFEWYCQARASQIPIDGPILREKALEIAALKGIENFTASNGWISRFKERYGLKFKKLCGESASCDDGVIQDWFSKLPTLIQGYDPRDIYNADETGLFYKCLPDHTLALKGEACHGGKSSKERLTVLLCTNSDGSDKRKPVVIGKSARPRCFKNIKSLPVIYRANSRAWITNEFFYRFLHDFDDAIGRQGRKVVLFVDNCSAHSKDISSLKNVKVIFYPPNCTSRVQPLDLGIIHSFKRHYRKNLVRKAVALIEEGNRENVKIDVLQAINFIVVAWENVSPETIQNCFKKAQGNVAVTENVSNHEMENDEIMQFEDGEGVTFDEYVSVDDKVVTSGVIDIEEMVKEKEGIENESEEDGESSTVVTEVPTFAEALKGFETVRNFLFSHELSEKEQKDLTNVENLLFAIRTKKCKQVKLSKFFSK